MAEKNNFRHHHSKLYDKRELSDKDQRLLGKFWETSATKQPLSYDRHMYFFDIIRPMKWKATWMNIVRDPVERFISAFYFNRDKERWKTVDALKKKSGQRPPESWFNMDLETCFPKRHPDCYPRNGQKKGKQIKYLCGAQSFCGILGDLRALQRAKRNVEESYAVVGIMEDMPLTFKVLQNYIPRFFKGLTMQEIGTGNFKLNVGKNKPNVSEAIKNKLKRQLKDEVEFYNFIRQRLHAQAAALEIGDTP